LLPARFYNAREKLEMAEREAEKKGKVAKANGTDAAKKELACAMADVARLKESLRVAGVAMMSQAGPAYGTVIVGSLFVDFLSVAASKAVFVGGFVFRVSPAAVVGFVSCVPLSLSLSHSQPCTTALRTAVPPPLRSAQLRCS